MTNSRRDAIFVMTRWLETHDFPDRMLPQHEDRAFVTDLVYTAIRRHRSLVWILEQCVKKMPKGETQAALLIGATQVLFMPSVADYAAIHETVEAVKLSTREAAGFVNAVLRTILRQREAFLAALEKQPIGIKTSHPESLVTRWTERFGAEETEALCTWDNQPAETWLAWPPTAPERFTKLPRGTRVEEVEGYAEGRFVVQDPATAGAIDLLDIKSGQAVLDACAAPGGKTIQIAWRMGTPAAGTENTHRLVALDLHEDRLVTLRANLARTQQTWVTAASGDFTQDPAPLRAQFGLFDRILLDVPCSNTGVLRRRPDARWRWTTKRMKQLCQMQATLLANACTLLAPGGRLVYSTCSLEPEENRQQITALRKCMPNIACVGVIEHLPTRTQTDGAFACALEREG
jgi:16S rRNA (cytosine967-C5)-methyltransferase